MTRTDARWHRFDGDVTSSCPRRLQRWIAFRLDAGTVSFAPREDEGWAFYPVRTNPDGSTDVYIGPTAPDGKAANWIQTTPGEGFFTILRLYNPLPSFFDTTWQPSENS